jgi:uncharacterized protein (DUF927 family)
MPQTDPYVAHVAARVVRMFQSYTQKIDPENESFLIFITDYLERNHVKDPKAIPYVQLYDQIKKGIREYLQNRETHTRSEKET